MRIGIDVGGTKIEGIALAADGRELARHRERTPTVYEEVLRAVAGVVARLENSVADAGSATVGVGTPGVLHPSRGVMLNSNLACLNDRPLDRDLAAALGRPVRLANDGKCFVLSEAIDGAAAPPADLDRSRPDVVFGAIARQDQIVHHPFQSFATVEAFLGAAVADPHVVGIKMTLYRIGQDSPLVDLLLEAAEAGKQVSVLVELKARFDERNNIQWARRLEAAGVHVVYGLVNLKTHCKLCLVVRKEHHGIRRYAHLGTGNYNAQTARAYTDLGIFTARPGVVEDVSHLFNYLTGYSNHRDFRALLTAPVTLRSGLTALIDRETENAAAGKPAAIIIKINAITDQSVIQSLYRASQAGVWIELIVRGVCSLRPGVPGVSDHIRVRSIVGRLLEHSRVFWFENDGQPEVFIGSVDLMERNLDRRVEVLCPLDPTLATHVRSAVLDVYLNDSRRARELTAEGHYVRPGEAGTKSNYLDAQETLLEWYQADARLRGHS